MIRHLHAIGTKIAFLYTPCVARICAAACIFLGSMQLAAQELPRLALVASGDNQSLEAMVALVEAELSKNDKLVILDRREINRILREHELSAANLVEPDKAVKAGQLLRADVFVLLTSEDSGPEDRGGDILRLRIVETAHGIRMRDSFLVLDGSEIEANAKSMAQRISNLSKKFNLPAGQTMPVGILDFARLEMGERHKLLARTLPAMFSARLSKEPRMIVLEREDLKLLQDEKSITRGKKEDFWGSGVLIDGYLRQKGKDKTELNVRLRQADGKQIASFEVPIDPLKPDSAINMASTEIVRELIDSPPQSSWRLKNEAKEFMRQGRNLMLHGRLEKGLNLIETAHALQPHDVYYTSWLFIYAWETCDINSTPDMPTLVHSKEDEIHYYSDIELAQLVSLMLSQLEDTKVSKNLLIKIFDVLGRMDVMIGYFASSTSVATDEIRNMNRLNRKIYANFIRKEIDRKPSYMDTVDVHTSWVSSDDPETAIANVRRTLRKWIMPPEKGGETSSPAERYKCCREWLEYPSRKFSLFKGSRQKVERLWAEYLEHLADCGDPIVEIYACSSLAYNLSDKQKVKKYSLKAAETSIQYLNTPNENLQDETKRALCYEVKICMRQLRRVDQETWVSTWEKIYAPLIQNSDAHTIFLWEPGDPFASVPTLAKEIERWDFESKEIKNRYLALLKKVLAVLNKVDVDNPDDLRQKVLLQDAVTDKDPGSQCELPVTMLLEDADPVPGDDLLTGTFRLEKNILWTAYPAAGHKLVVAGIDLKQKETIALWKAKIPEDRKGPPHWEWCAPKLAIYEDAIYLSFRKIGLIKYPGSVERGKKTLDPPEILTEEDGLPSIHITGMAQDKDHKIWIGYGSSSLPTESGLGIYDVKNKTWETVLCSSLPGGPLTDPCSVVSVRLVADNKLVFVPNVTKAHGFWVLNTETRKSRKVWEYCPGYLKFSSGKWWVRTITGLIRYYPTEERLSFILGTPYLRKTVKGYDGGNEELFLPESVMRKFEYHSSDFATSMTIDLGTCDIHENKLWALIGKERLIAIPRGKTYKDAAIMKNNLLNGKKVSKFYSTPYGLVAVGKDSIGLIDTRADRD